MKRETLAKKNIKHACDWLLGELENVLMDYPEDSAEYQNALSRLQNHEELSEELYDMAISDLYLEGACFYDCNIVSEIRFLGKDWLMEECRRRIEKESEY